MNSEKYDASKTSVDLRLQPDEGCFLVIRSVKDNMVTFRKVWSVRMNDEDPLSNESNNEAAEFSPDGKLLAAGCGDAHVRVLSVPEGEIVKDFELYGGVCEGYEECHTRLKSWKSQEEWN